MRDQEAAGGSRAVLVRLGLLGLLVAAGVVLALTVGLPDEERLRAAVRDAGPWGPVLFVVGYALATLAPLPKAVLSAAAGLVFGLVVGVVLVLVAATAGALMAFWIGRRLGRTAVERFTGARVARLDAVLRDRGLLAVIALRLVPVLPFTAVNYSAGLTAVRTRDYVLGTIVGMVPGTVGYVALGVYGTGSAAVPVLGTVVLTVLLWVGLRTLLARRRAV